MRDPRWAVTMTDAGVMISFDAHHVLRQRFAQMRAPTTELAQILRDTQPVMGVSSLDLDRSRKGTVHFSEDARRE